MCRMHDCAKYTAPTILVGMTVPTMLVGMSVVSAIPLKLVVLQAIQEQNP